MKDENFTTSFSVSQSPDEVFAAIQNVRGWWSEEIDGGTAKLNDEFAYRNGDVHRCRMKLKEVVAGEKMVWQVLENYFKFTEDNTEWAGTEIVFDVSKKGNTTELQFTHRGLVPEFGCYDICSNAWGSYVTGSLKSLITTGKGKPNPKE